MIPNIHICHSERTDGHLQFMYKPITDSLVNMFNYLRHVCEIGNIIVKRGGIEWSDISSYDIFIWIGNENLTYVPFETLSQRNVYTIFFDTEPGPINCPFNDIGEIWTYSIYNILKSDNVLKCKFKYIFLSLKSNNIIDYYDKNIHLYHFGPLIQWNNERSRTEKWKLLENYQILKDKLIIETNVWDEKSYSNLLTRNNFGIILNLHKKNCYSLESVRINKFLSNGVIIISEHCCQEEEELYKNMVFFSSLDMIEKLFIRITKLSNDQLESLSKLIYYNYQKISDNDNYIDIFMDAYLSYKNYVDKNIDHTQFESKTKKYDKNYIDIQNSLDDFPPDLINNTSITDNIYDYLDKIEKNVSKLH